MKFENLTRERIPPHSHPGGRGWVKQGERVLGSRKGLESKMAPSQALKPTSTIVLSAQTVDMD